MQTLYQLILNPLFSLEQAWEILENQGVEILYSSEEEEVKELFVSLSDLETLKIYPWIEHVNPYTLPPIDWEAQWLHHAPHFRDGYLQLNLKIDAGKSSTIRLQPGAGFGDLSHPTTRLMVSFLEKKLEKGNVIDIGSGSGVLSLVAAQLGAKTVQGIDIDPVALSHSEHNAQLNDLQERCTFCLPEAFRWKKSQTAFPLILMNMIWQEQEVAWKSLGCLHSQPANLFISGILLEERDEYVEHVFKTRGWVLQEEREESGWVGFWFKS